MFLIDLKQGREFSWEYLIDDIHNESVFYPFCLHYNLYEYFKNIVLAILSEKNVCLIDYTFTSEEIKKLLRDYSRFLGQTIKVKIKKISSKEQLIDYLRSSKNWSITLFTSGTTGLPKKVIHTHDSLIKNVKISDKHKEDIWGFAYNITHIAGVQVFLQALLNGNQIVNLFGIDRELILNALERYKITHISSTPTFYRMLFPLHTKKFTEVKRVTLGGEKSDNRLINELSNVFINAKILNTYAATEFGTLLVTNDGELFSIPPRYINRVKIVDNELWVHRSLMGIFDIPVDEWYKTGDHIEIVSSNPLRFKIIGRQSDFVNVAGYKVNLLEVEEAIRKINGIKDVKVYPKRNSVIGNIICADIVCIDSSITELSIVQQLSKFLQEYKIPRIIRFVDTLSTTRTGKLK